MIEDKVFGVISYLPDKEPDRSLRIERLNRMFNNIISIFGQVNWLIIAQNWKDYKVPTEIISNSQIYEFEKLGILNARKELRERFLDTTYNWLIMLDDDCIIKTQSEDAGKQYFKMLDDHPNGFMFLKNDKGEYCASQLNMCAISRYIYSETPMVNIDPEKEQGFEDWIFATLLHYKHNELEFDCDVVSCHHYRNSEEKAPSTWSDSHRNKLKLMSLRSKLIISFIKKRHFDIDKIKKSLGMR